MPKMRVLTSVAGDGFTWSPGEIVEVDEKTARAWCDGKRAELVRTSEIETTAGEKPPETAVTRRSRRPKRT